jgi:hypothetical protein
MKKLVVLILASLLVANIASAVVDPDTNSMGFYFDLNADVYEFVAAPYAIYPCYVMLTNPDFDAVFGYEFGYDVAPLGAFTITGTVLNGTGAIDVGGAPQNHIVGLAAPIATSAATLIATVNVFVLSAEPLSFTLHGATPNSIPGSVAPSLLLAGDQIIPTGLSAGFDEITGLPNVCAFVNGTGVVATDEASWDQVKSLYR